MNELQISKTILNQITTLTPRSVFWSWGASAFRSIKENQIDLGHDYYAGILFYVRGLLHKGQVTVTLTPMDTYTVTIGNLRKGNMSIKKQIEDVHFPELPSILDSLIERNEELES